MKSGQVVNEWSGEKNGNTNQSFSPKQCAKTINTDKNKYNRWIFVLNNPTVANSGQLITYFNNNCSYNKFDNSIRDYQFQKEIGDSGTEHFQGRFKLKDRIRFSKLKKDIGIPTIHLEKENNEEASKAYCIKSDTATNEQYSGTGASPLIKIKLMIDDAKKKLDYFEGNYDANLWQWPQCIFCDVTRFTKCYWHTIDELLDIDDWLNSNMAMYLDHTNYTNNL